MSESLAISPGNSPDKLKSELKYLALKVLSDQVSGLVFEAGQSALEWWAGLPDGDSNTTASALQKAYKERFTAIIHQEGRLQKELDTALGRISGEQLVESRRLINSLLNDLAATGYQHEVDLGNVSVRLPAEVILPALGELDPSSMVYSLKGKGQDIWNSICNIFHKGTLESLIRRKSNYRVEARVNYSKPDISTKAKAEILKELDKALDATDVFGIPDQIIRGLKESICEALYLST